MTLDELQASLPALKEASVMVYQVSGLPDPDCLAFEYYLLTITPEQGLCKVTASGNTVDTNAFGSQLKDEATRFEKILTESYGPPSRRANHLRPGSIWDAPGDWMMSLVKLERMYALLWQQDDGNTIAVFARGLSSDSGFVTLTYQFPNFTACAAEAKEASVVSQK
jgi:hypothetical protein